MATLFRLPVRRSRSRRVLRGAGRRGVQLAALVPALGSASRGARSRLFARPGSRSSLFGPRGAAVVLLAGSGLAAIGWRRRRAAELERESGAYEPAPVAPEPSATPGAPPVDEPPAGELPPMPAVAEVPMAAGPEGQAPPPDAAVAGTEAVGPPVPGEGPTLDEQAEVDAAAAEAAAIGGRPESSTGREPGVTVDPAEEPVAGAGGGIAEGQEQAESDRIETTERPE